MDYETASRLWRYDSETGRITWRVTVVSRGPHGKAGQVAGRYTDEGYRQIKYKGRAYGAHRIAWLLHYRQWPVGVIDHKNGAPDDNRITNLRDCTQAENSRNCHKVVGASFDKTRGKWRAEITKDRKIYRLGRFATKELAVEAYRRATREKFGEFSAFN